ncbi:MAG: DEAD/DEAH box helicase [Betaproteobacteria bacterium]|nr:DEAD/DEAH box helicase [Betaproteobacteria bacterium]
MTEPDTADARFDALGLDPLIQRALDDLGYTSPTPIQVKAVPAAMQGRDIVGIAQTGTGKTAAFSLPILQRMLPHANTSASPARHPVRALILTPTRELALQVEESVRNFSRNTPFRILAIYGGVPMDPQVQALRKGVEILVATPGRLLDHLKSKLVNLGTVQHLVLDEADRMLDMGFIDDIRAIVSKVPEQRQTLFFSATFSPEIRRLADSLLTDPVTVEVARRNSPADLVNQQVVEIDSDRKRGALLALIRERQLPQILVFCGTKIGANRLTQYLVREGVEAAAIHSDKTQGERIKALDAFKSGGLKVLVATDVAARGIDIEQLPMVVNFDLPGAAEDYVHRIGRTGRAGCPGEAVSFVSPEESRNLADIENLLKKPIPRIAAPVPADTAAGGRERYARGGEARGASRSSERVPRDLPIPRLRDPATEIDPMSLPASAFQTVEQRRSLPPPSRRRTQAEVPALLRPLGKADPAVS